MTSARGALAVICLISGPSPALSQSGPPSRQAIDPYGAEANQAALSQYRQERSAGMENIRTVYFAAMCGVLPEKERARTYFLDVAQALTDASLASGPPDYHLMDTLNSAAQQGLAQGQKPHACEYWRQHPDAVLQVRQVVENATP